MFHPHEATHLAEQATLGALILDPTPLTHIRGWLRPGDFDDALHGQIFTVLCELHTAGEPITPVAVGDALPGHQPGWTPAVRVHNVLQAVPSPRHATAYAQIVAEGGLRREVAGLGVLLQAGALQSATSRESVPLTSTCHLVDTALTTAAHRWDTATSAPPLTARPTATSNPTSGVDDQYLQGAPVELRPALRNPDLRLGADKLLRTHPARDEVAEHAHEGMLVCSLITHPKDIALVAACLPPTRISSPKWRTVYGATLELAETGQPVDLVTVTHAVARLSHHDQPTPTLRDLQTIVDLTRFTPPKDVERLVWADQMRRIADHGAAQLVAGANNPGLLITDLTDTGHLITTALRDAARMLPVHATDPRPQPVTVLPVEATRRPVAR